MDAPASPSSAPASFDVNDQLRKQAEYYFSTENLFKDKYLISIMNPRMMVPLSVIASFKKVRLLTQDMHALQRALSESEKLYLEADMTGAMWVGPFPHASPRSRCTVVLDSVPGGATREHLQDIIQAPILHVFMFPDYTWYVTFESDKVCKQVFLALQNAQLLGYPVRARIRVEQNQGRGGNWNTGFMNGNGFVGSPPGYQSVSPLAGAPLYVGGNPHAANRHAPPPPPPGPPPPFSAEGSAPSSETTNGAPPRSYPMGPAPVEVDMGGPQPVHHAPPQHKRNKRQGNGVPNSQARAPDMKSFPALEESSVNMGSSVGQRTKRTASGEQNGTQNNTEEPQDAGSYASKLLGS